MLAHQNKAHAASQKFVTINAAQLYDIRNVVAKIGLCRIYTARNPDVWNVQASVNFTLLRKNGVSVLDQEMHIFWLDNSTNPKTKNPLAFSSQATDRAYKDNLETGGATSYVTITGLNRTRNNYIYVGAENETSSKPIKWFMVGHSLALPVCN